MLDHLARCPECRQILELAIPVTETETVPSIRSVRRGWLSGPALRWGFATAAILTLVSGGVLQYAHQHRDHELASSSAPQAKLTTKQGFAATPGPVRPTARSAAPPVQEPKSAAGNPQTMARSQSAPAKSDLQKARESGLSVGMKSEAEAEAMARPRASDQLIQNQAAAASQYQSYTSSDVVKAKAAVSAQASGDSRSTFYFFSLCTSRHRAADYPISHAACLAALDNQCVRRAAEVFRRRQDVGGRERECRSRAGAD